jgi:hypothetical protein
MLLAESALPYMNVMKRVRSHLMASTIRSCMASTTLWNSRAAAGALAPPHAAPASLTRKSRVSRSAMPDRYSSILMRSSRPSTDSSRFDSSRAKSMTLFLRAARSRRS